MKLLRLTFSVKFLLFIALLAIPLFLFNPPRAYAYNSWQTCESANFGTADCEQGYNGTDFGWWPIASNSECGTKPGACYTRGSGKCNTACSSSCGCVTGSNDKAWAKYVVGGCVSTGTSGSYTWLWQYSLDCYTSNKCLQGETFIRYGMCSCDYGGGNQTCCNGNNAAACTQVGSYTPIGANRGTCGGLRTVNYGSSCVQTYSLTAHVFVDYNGDGFQGTDEPDYAPGNFSPASNTISYSGGVSGANPTGAGGNYIISNIPNTSTETITVNPPGSGWTATTTNSVGPVDISQTAPVNFGIKPPAPTCTITANPTTVQAGGTATLTTNVIAPPTYTGNLTYTWTPGGQVLGSITSASPLTTASTTVNNTIWKSPLSGSWDQGQTSQPQVTVCISGTSGANTCGSCQVGVATPPAVIPPGPPISYIPLYSISGFAYTDLNKNRQFDSSIESHYKDKSLNVSICPDTTNGGTTTRFCTDPGKGGTAIPTKLTDGSFDTTAAIAGSPSLYTLTPGAYRVTLSLAGLDSSYSTSGNTYSITVGKPCPVAVPNEPSGSCEAATGNVTNVGLGITNSNVWIQSTGGDVYMGGANSVNDFSRIPQNACGGSYMSIKNDAAGIASPGIIYTGTNSTIDFGAGQASPFQNGTSSPWNWVVGQYPVSPAAAQTIKTPIRITYANRVAALGGDTSKLTVLPNPASYGNYDLSAAGLTHGSYWVNGDLTINNPSLYTFTGGNFEILVSGNLHIRTKIHVDPGSTVLFAAAKNIYVSGNVGEADHTSTTSDLEGFYSAPNFIVSNSVSDTDTSLNRCPASDSRLNMQGAVIGNFEIYRDLCAGDICPTFSIQARPDFTISAPASYLHSSIIQQELSP